MAEITIPKRDTVFRTVAFLASKYGGIIVGSYALKLYNPSYRVPNDVDIISNNPQKLVEIIVRELNKKYGNKYKYMRSLNAYRIYNTKTNSYIADIVRYPILESEYVTYNGLNVAKPDFVYRGKRKQKMGSMVGNVVINGLMPMVKGPKRLGLSPETSYWVSR